MILRTFGAILLWVLLWWPPSRRLLESDMALHMAVQLPLLVCIGLLLGVEARKYEPCWFAEADWLGIPGLLLTVFATSFWMLPRLLDAALNDASVDLVKFLSLPLLSGLPLGLSWQRMPGLGRAFVWANFIPKLGAIGGLYLAAPLRLCITYRIDQQVSAGWALIGVAVTLATVSFVVTFVGMPREEPEGRPIDP